MIVRTRQHKNVPDIIEKNGRFTPDPAFVASDMAEFKDLKDETYGWLAKNMKTKAEKPVDAVYPVWLSLNRGSNYPIEGGAVFVLDVPDDAICLISIEKWCRILDFRYIPENEEDELRHKKLLELYGTGDAAAFMSRFYPDIKREIRASWPRLFDVEGLPAEACYGLAWELRKEWIIEIIR